MDEFLKSLNITTTADVSRYDRKLNAIVPVLKRTDAPGETFIGSNITVGYSPNTAEHELLVWIFELMGQYFNINIHYVEYSRLWEVQDALDRGKVDLGMMFNPITGNHSQQTVVARLEQNLYLPINHTHHSSTFFLDIFSLELRYAILGFVLLITLLNALLMSRHSPWRHLLFLYELLSGTQARPYRRGQHPYVPNRMLQLLLGAVQQIVVCALATFLVAQLSIPIIYSPFQSVADLADHPEYSLCIPRMHNFFGHLASFVRFKNFRNKIDRECHRRVNDPDRLAEYLCDARRHVVLITNDIVLNNIFPDRSRLDRMCELQLIQRGLIKNWVAIPYGSHFKHGEQIKRL
ncbi:binding-protein-dependent transport systems inner membrane component [Anopheles sinensis]|uniref:Binding-protein-dependent transport systems inner membrane component n=1 Tax=Anopheles sinensis TaxID=74873 RepID=A0A084VUI0_ANOSI|nr:binding-protein-dependent transport systems inner membrane component [Anopheles sinensis]